MHSKYQNMFPKELKSYNINPIWIHEIPIDLGKFF